MRAASLSILSVFATRNATAGTMIHQADFDSAIQWNSGSVADEENRQGIRELLDGGYIIEHSSAFELTAAGATLMNDARLSSRQLHVPVQVYAAAQRAMADLKATVYAVLASVPDRGLTNSEIGRALGIYAGHIGHEGHISRTLLGFLEAEGVAEQDAISKRWRLASR